MKDVDSAAPGKLLLIALIVIGCFGYIIAAQFTNNGNDTAIAWTTLGSAMGYLLGHGPLDGRRGQETVPPFVPAKDQTP